ncbi:death-on-curing protein [Mucilaginibacter gracilis]|uniref:Death-on-curing protein n=1 Tax=Mucilaginibacter gracilis TaxID=423350 RepID=A0A495IY36_9SPHI|nr:type II toxin-antitoxin system death-on-curing family toxin [Mucilaginibacter gracilis]RKR81616.1 death-on-curing protein [Mucilaginibacter gracilis]
MIGLNEVKNIHEILIQQFGGGNGIRDINLLQSALARPFATFVETDLYPTTIDKASAILESILINHPFIDGNKRTGYVLMRLILLEAGLDIIADEHEKYAMVIAVSKGDYRFDEIKKWLTKHVKQHP